MYREFLGFDFSAAAPWLLTGIVLGAFFSWLLRALFRRPPQEPQIIPVIDYALIDERDRYKAAADQYASDLGHYQSALADAERRASTIPSYLDSNERLRQSAGEISNELEAALIKAHAAQAEASANSARAATIERQLSDYKAKFAGAEDALNSVPVLRSSLDAAQMQIKSTMAELAQTKSIADSLNSEIDRLRADNETLQHAAEKARNLDNSAGLHSEIHALKEQNASLTAALETARRVALNNDGSQEIERLNQENAGLRAMLEQGNDDASASDDMRGGDDGRFVRPGFRMRPFAPNAFNGRRIIPVAARNGMSDDAAASEDVSSLRAQISQLTSDVERLKRLQDAVSAANKIASE